MLFSAFIHGILVFLELLVFLFILKGDMSLFLKSAV